MAKVGKLEEKVSPEPEEIEVHWEIPYFMSLNNRYHESPDFKFLTTKWHLEIDPFDNTSPTSDKYIALRLERVKVELSCNTLCTFSIKKADGLMTGIRSLIHVFSFNNNRLKVDRFFTRHALQEHESELMPSNILTIMCNMKPLSDKSGSWKFKGNIILFFA